VVLSLAQQLPLVALESLKCFEGVSF